MTSAPTLTIRHAACRAIFVFDVGREVDFAACLRLVPDLVRARPPAERSAPTSMRVATPALRLLMAVPELAIAGRRVESSAQVSVYDFGAVAVTLTIPAGTSLEELGELACDLAATTDLAAAARSILDSLVERIKPSIKALEVAALVEDYAVFEVTDFESPVALDAMAREFGGSFARILRAERVTLSAQEVEHATSTTVTRTPGDVVFIDWNAALAFHAHPDEVREVLELANVQLLEMRFLDSRLAESLHQSYDVVSGSALWRPVFLPSAMRIAVRRIAQGQVDSVLLFERVNNALKLVGDQYLARVYRSAALRFEMAAWNDANERKLATLETIYEKVQDRSSARRAEVLEWIVIVLIIVSSALPFVIL